MQQTLTPLSFRIAVLSTVCSALMLSAAAGAGELDPLQLKWYEKYRKQKNAPLPADMLLNGNPEPDLTEGYTPLFNGQNLEGWTPRGGTCRFEVQEECIVGVCVPGSPSTYLCTEKSDYRDFIFTCDVKWDVDCNSGVMFRARVREEKGNAVVYGPQAEMEGTGQDRGWSGGIYGQSCGGYFYPLWLIAHHDARKAIQADSWNRITVEARGNEVRTWVNGVPAAYWIDDGEYPAGFFGLQIHKGNAGQVRFRNLRIREL